MAKQQTDEELNLKRKARRRLIGALALSLAVVVILPMVLDSEPKSTGEDIDLRIPAPDKVPEFIPSVAISEVPEVPFAASMVVAVSAPDAASAVAAVSAPIAEVIEIEPPVVPVKVVEPVPAVVEKTKEKVKDAAKKEDATKTVESKKAVEVKKAEETKKSTSTDPAAILEGREKDTGNGESYVAQIGAFSNPVTAKQELAKLKGWGFKAYTEKVGNKIRVRVGR